MIVPEQTWKHYASRQWFPLKTLLRKQNLLPGSKNVSQLTSLQQKICFHMFPSPHVPGLGALFTVDYTAKNVQKHWAFSRTASWSSIYEAQWAHWQQLCSLTLQSIIHLRFNIPFLSSNEIPRPSTISGLSAQRIGEIEGSVNLSLITFEVTMVTLDSVNLMRTVVFRNGVACCMTWTPRTPEI